MVTWNLISQRYGLEQDQDGQQCSHVPFLQSVRPILSRPSPNKTSKGSADALLEKTTKPEPSDASLYSTIRDFIVLSVCAASEPEHHQREKRARQPSQGADHENQG